MINLLPPEEKQKLLQEKKEKLAITWGVVVLISLCCLILILLSIKFYILADTDYQKNMLAQAEQKAKTAEFMSLTGVIKKYNGILTQLNSFYKKEVYSSRALEIITDVPSPSGLRFTGFSLSRNEAGVIKAVVSGVSSTRDGLLVFKKNVENEKNIKNPSFSPESWINPKNASFTLTFEID